MRNFLKYFYHSFPIQLLLLHFRKSQILLFFWLILFLTITGHFMKSFGADGLFLAPEYLGKTSYTGALIVGIACGIYIISWNIITFILHSSRFRFLAATTNPFLKYVLNNSLIPIAFLIVYFFEAYHYVVNYELISLFRFFLGVLSFFVGLALILVVSFLYFFRADKMVFRSIQPGVIDFDDSGPVVTLEEPESFQSFELPVVYYFSSFFKFRKARDVSHYSLAFLDSIFKKHHFSAMMTVLLAFFFILMIGFFQDNPVFQIPAGASVFIIFAITLSAMGALGYFLRSWIVLFAAFLFILLNTLYRYDIINLRNRSYGLDYRRDARPAYTLESLQSLSSPDKVARDKENMLSILERWKARQREEKPLLVMLNFGGGGLRGAGFSMNVLQHLDSALDGSLMHKSFMITGASGGMLAAAYYRELSRMKDSGYDINLQNKDYLRHVTEDLLNPVFSSLLARDMIAPTQKFTYNDFSFVKDRGYAFEQKLNENTRGVLNRQMKFYEKDEYNASIPLMLFSSSVVRDLKKMVISTQPVSFLMNNSYTDNASSMSGPDVIDFSALFSDRSPMGVSVLSALRMNATYPYVLPAVWLPTQPVIDVMDAGLRDNYGTELSLRFIHVFRSWIKENTRGVLIVQARSKRKGSWGEQQDKSSIIDPVSRPFSMLQSNWFNLQDYFQDDEMSYVSNSLGSPLYRVSFMYEPDKKQAGAPLSFHLTARERKEVEASLQRDINKKALIQTLKILQGR